MHINFNHDFFFHTLGNIVAAAVVVFSDVIFRWIVVFNRYLVLKWAIQKRCTRARTKSYKVYKSSFCLFFLLWFVVILCFCSALIATTPIFMLLINNLPEKGASIVWVIKVEFVIAHLRRGESTICKMLSFAKCCHSFALRSINLFRFRRFVYHVEILNQMNGERMSQF